MQEHVSRLNSVLQFRGGHARQRNAIVVTEINDRVAVNVGSN